MHLTNLGYWRHGGRTSVSVIFAPSTEIVTIDLHESFLMQTNPLVAGRDYNLVFNFFYYHIEWKKNQLC